MCALLLLYNFLHPTAEPHERMTGLKSVANKTRIHEGLQKPEESTLGAVVHAVADMLKVPCSVSELSRKYKKKIGPDLKEFGSDGRKPATSRQLGKYLKVSRKEVKALRNVHKRILSLLPHRLAPGEVHGNGVVITADGHLFPSALVCIKWIRNINPDIPIELFISDVSLWEPAYCETLLPALNVKCICLEIMYGTLYRSLSGSGGYVNKALALLGSGFDNIYYTDADSLPLMDVNDFFESSIFEQTGFVLTSDFWPRTTSPSFYDIAGLELGSEVSGKSILLQVDRENAIPGRATESGQMLIRKSQHCRLLALALYYNVRGDVWWPLLTQDAPGEGDKEVWAAAAHVLGEPWYQTTSKPLELGLKHSGTIQGFAIAQPHFQQDYEINHEHRKELAPQYMALHSQVLKFNLRTIVMINGGKAPTKRFFGSRSSVQQNLDRDDDIELRLWSTIRDVTCDWVVQQNRVPIDWLSENVDNYCDFLNAYVRKLEENPEGF